LSVIFVELKKLKLNFVSRLW